MLGIPYVCATCQNTFGTLPGNAYSSVAIDDRAEACRAVEYLVSLGYNRIVAIVAWKDDCSISELRLTGYRETLEKHGIPFDPSLVIESGSFSQPDAAKATEKRLPAADARARYQEIPHDPHADPVFSRQLRTRGDGSDDGKHRSDGLPIIIVYLFCQKCIIKGVISGAVKG